MTTPSGSVQPPGAEPAPDDTASDVGVAQDRDPDGAQAGRTSGRATTTGSRGVVRRPLEMYLGAAFLTVAALPLIMVGGVLAGLVGRLGATLRRRIVDAAGSADPDTLVLVARVAGAVALLVGVLFVALAWLAVRPLRRARTAVATLAALEMTLLVVAMVATAPDPVSLGLTLLAGAGVALLYLPRSEEFLLSQG